MIMIQFPMDSFGMYFWQKITFHKHDELIGQIKMFSMKSDMSCFMCSANQGL